MLSINNRFIVRIIFAIIISFMVQFQLLFDDGISCYAIIHGDTYFNLKCTFIIILQHFKKFSTELLKQMGLFWFIIENEMQMHEKNLVEVLLL